MLRSLPVPSKIRAWQSLSGRKGEGRNRFFGEGAVGDAWSACAPSELPESMVLGTASPGWRLNACVPSGLWRPCVCVPSGLWRPCDVRPFGRLWRPCVCVPSGLWSPCACIPLGLWRTCVCVPLGLWRPCDVPVEKLISPYQRTLANLQSTIQDLPHVMAFDNVDLRSPFRKVAVFEHRKQIHLEKPVPKWLRRIL